MTLSLSELRQQCREHVDDTMQGQNFFTDQELDTWINDAVKTIARRAETFQTTATIGTLANVKSYTGPTDYIRAYAAEWSSDSGVTTYPLEIRSRNEMTAVWGVNQNWTGNNPAYCVIEGWPPNLNIILFPVPSQSGQLFLYYYRLPAIVVSSDDPVEVVQGWEDLIPLYVEYTALRKDRQARWSEAKQLFEEAMVEHIEQTRAWTDQAGAIVTNTGNYLPYAVWGGGDDFF